ncbi:MAG: AI-2E family transporter [Oscillospiraceae bacterium]|nr:AI-2E family transporter [Oscillospiraceae bacterium]
MKQKFEFTKKGATISAYVIIVFAICLLMVGLVFKWRSFVAHAANIVSVFSPIIWAVVIAYLLNPIMCFFEKHLRRIVCRKRERKKLLRVLSITITMTFTILFLIALVATIVPALIDSYISFSSNFSGYWDNLTNAAGRLRDINPHVYDYIMKSISDSRSYATALFERFAPQINQLIDAAVNLGASAISFVLGVADALCGWLISVYLLFNKETLLAQMRKICYGFIPTKRCDRMLEIAYMFDRTIIDFISGKVVDSFIIGIMCFIGVSIMKMPFSVLISVIVGVTNVIPFFGPFIGAIPCILLLVLTDPIKAVWFAIFILILQQFDGNILGPKILGNKLGLPTFWTLFAILIGGGLFGFIGMILFIPIFAVCYKLFTETVRSRLAKKNLPCETSAYMSPIGLHPKQEDVIADTLMFVEGVQKDTQELLKQTQNEGESAK